MNYLKNFIPKKAKKLVTHNGSFHADDVFSAAALSLLLEKNGEKSNITRTRDEKVIANGDYVFDVGGIYDEDKNRFDHHQPGGSGKRANGVEYSSFGLIWKKFGAELCGSEKAAALLDKTLVQPVDAFDNGLSLVEKKHEIVPYLIQHMFLSMCATWLEGEGVMDENYFKSVSKAKEILQREILQTRHILLAEDALVQAYESSPDKRIIILDKKYPYEEILNRFPEPLYAVVPRSDKSWKAEAVRDNFKSFVNRKDFPKAWAGLRGEELQKVSGVPDALFCHRGLFMAVAGSKEGAVKLAQIAVQS